jgi:hypothetical protein
MSYASGSLIDAADYNGLVSSGASNIGNVWGTGRASFGYGQDVSLISTVSVSTTITATQWAGLVFTLNRAIGHQWGSGTNQLANGSNIGIVAGATIAAFANVSTMTSNIATNRLLFNAQGSTVTGSNFTASQSFADSTSGYQFTTARTVTFASGNAARYFFNAGGALRFFVSGTSNNGTARSADYVTLYGTNLAGSNVRAFTSVGRIGTSGTLLSSNSAAGYYSLTTTPTTIANIASSSATYQYNNDFVRVNLTTNGTQGPNSDQGTTVTFTLLAQQPGQTNSNFNDAVDVTVTTRVDIVLPSTTFLANTWGVIGVT